MSLRASRRRVRGSGSKLNQRLQYAASPVVEALESRQLLSVGWSYHENFENFQPSGVGVWWTGGDIETSPASPSTKFMAGGSGTVSLELGGQPNTPGAIPAHDYITISLRLYIIGDTYPQEQYEQPKRDGETIVEGEHVVLSGAGGPNWTFRALNGGQELGSESYGFGPYDDSDGWHFYAAAWPFAHQPPFTDSKNPDYANPLPLLAHNTLGYDIWGQPHGTYARDSLVHNSCYTDRDDSIYAFTIQLPHTSSSIRLEFNSSTESSTARWGIDDVDVEAITPSCCMPGDSSEYPVRYSDGTARINGTDLSSSGYGMDWTVGRTWSNNPQFGSVGPFGNGWQTTGAPRLIEIHGNPDTVVQSLSGTSDRWYDAVSSGGNTYAGRYGNTDVLTHDQTNHLFYITESSGARAEYYDFSGSLPAQRGQLRVFKDAQGNTTTLNYDPDDGRLVSVVRTNGDPGLSHQQLDNQGLPHEQIDYTYGSTSGGNSYITTIELKRDNAVVQKAEYTYYNGSDSNGRPGDLKKVEVTLNGDYGPKQTTYYRYYVNNTSGGYVGGLKYVLGPEAYARASEYGNPQYMTDAQLATYADNYFQYDSSNSGITSHRVTQETASGAGGGSSGQGAFAFTYGINGSNTDLGPTTWYTRTVETLPDSSKNVVYSNYASQPMLRIHEDPSGRQLGTFFKYDSAGRIIWEAESSALALPSPTQANPYPLDAYNDLLHAVSGNYEYMRDDQGLIHVTDYYTDTSAGPTKAGGVNGYVQDTKVQRGENGTPILQTSTQYYAYVDSGSSTYPVARSVQYRNTDGTGAQTTLYSYTWRPGGVAMLSQTTSYPAISSAQNGPGPISGTLTAAGTQTTLVDTSRQEPSGYFVGYALTISSVEQGGTVYYSSSVTAYDDGTFTLALPFPLDLSVAGTTYTLSCNQVEYYDASGRVQWTRDADGFITYTAYNDATGAVVKSIQDVDTAQSSDFDGNSPPTHWFTPSGGGLHLITQMPQPDTQGRTTKRIEPNGSVTWIVYKDGDNGAQEVYVYPGVHQISQYTWTTTGPVQITRSSQRSTHSEYVDQEFVYYTDYFSDSITIAPPVLWSEQPTGSETLDIGNVLSLQRDYYNAAGQLIKSDRYYSFAGMGELPAQDPNESDDPLTTGNYYRTVYGYDSAGRQNRVQLPTGTIQRTVYDSFGNVLSQWVGTDDENATDSNPAGTGSNNMKNVADYYYEAPALPSLGQSAGGTLAARTYYVRITLVTPQGETAPSPEQAFPVGANQLLVVPSPVGAIGATGYNVYVSTISGQETLQNATPANLGVSRWMEPTSGLISGAALSFNGIGNGKLTQVNQHSGNAADRVSLYMYDFRNRLVLTKEGAEASESSSFSRPLVYNVLDNLGEVTRTYQYDGAQLPLGAFLSSVTNDTVPNALYPNKVRALSLSSYDDQGRIYQSKVLKVDPVNGVSGNDALVLALPALVTNKFYNGRGNVMAVSQPGGQVTKYAYDGAGRQIKTSVTDGGVFNGAAQNWTNAGTLTNDIVFEQTLNYYDGNGNVIQTVQRQRFDNDPTGSTGKGNLAGPAGGDLASRDYYTDYYYDQANRLTSQATIGTNGGSTWTRPSGPQSRTSTYLLTEYSYDADAVQIVTLTGTITDGTFTLSFMGYPTDDLAHDAPATTVQSALEGLTSIGSNNIAVTGPNGGPYTIRFIGTLGGQVQPLLTSTFSLSGDQVGMTVATASVGGDNGRVQQITDPREIITKSDFDALGRTVRTINAFDTGVPTSSLDQTTTYAYDGSDHLIRQTAVMPAGTPSQHTCYDYGVDYDGTSNHIGSKELLARIHYPRKTAGDGQQAGDPSLLASEQQSFTYDRLGEKLSSTDQNGTVHSYQYDLLGRMTADIVTTLGSNVDGAVRRIGFAFDSAGRLFRQVSYSSDSQPVNELRNIYNGFGQLTIQYQEHSGAVNTSSSAKVQYAYAEASGGSRLTSITYPGGRVVNYTYTGIDSTMSRVTALVDSGTTLEGYSYLGLGTIVQRTHPQTSVMLTYIQQSGDTLCGTDAGDRYTGLDRFGRVVDQFWVDPADLSAPIDRFQYGYDADGNVLYKQVLTPSGSSFSELYHDYPAENGDYNSYDMLNRLTYFRRGVLSDANDDGILDTVDSASRTQNWTLDALGNWSSLETNGTSVNRTHNAQNQVTAVGGTALSFDNDGNTTQDESGQRYVYDAWNRMVAVKDSAGNVSESLTYLASGGRGRGSAVGLCGTTTVTRSYYSMDWQLLERVDTSTPQGSCSSTTTTSTYVWSLAYIDELVAKDALYTGGGTSRTYVQQDANHNVTSTKMVGGGTTRFVYDPYGSATVLSFAFTPTTGSMFDFGFQGGLYDSTSGLYNFRYRDYSTSLGRWMEQDPAGYVDGLSVYQLVRSNPVRSTDPSGLLSWDNASTKWIQQATLQVPSNPAPNGIFWITSQNALAATVPRMVMRFRFVCSSSGGPWRLESTKVKFWSEVYLYPDATYTNWSVSRDWVRRAENDHVKDMLDWAHHEGEGLAERLEEVEKLLTFTTFQQADASATTHIFEPVKASMLAAYNISKTTHDVSRRHRWGDPNQRP